MCQKNKKYHHQSFSLSEQVKELIKKLSNYKSTTQSQLVRDLILTESRKTGLLKNETEGSSTVEWFFTIIQK